MMRQLISDIPAVTKISICKKPGEGDFVAFERGEEPNGLVLYTVMDLRFYSDTGTFKYTEREVYQPKEVLKGALATKVSVEKLKLIRNLQDNYSREVLMGDEVTKSETYWALIPTRQQIADAITSTSFKIPAIREARASMGGAI